ncbi:MAG: 3'-5' exonuclease [Acidimicrobiales bacterium]
MTAAYGLDIETDTSLGGLDPRTSPILAVALASDTGVTIIRGPETRILREVDSLLGLLAPGVIVTWNGSGFDLPFLADRARRHGLRLGLRLSIDPGIVRFHPPLPGHAGFYRASWYGHDHLDAYLAYRALATEDEGSLALKAVAARRGLSAVEVDRSRIHQLSPDDLASYVASDAGLALALARARWDETVAFLDRRPPVPDLAVAGQH